MKETPVQHPVLGPWIGFGSAFTCFVLAGQALGSRSGEALDSLGVELPLVTEAAVRHARVEAAAAIVVGLVLAVLTRVRFPGRAGLAMRVYASLFAIAAAGTAALFIYASVLAFESIQVALQQ